VYADAYTYMKESMGKERYRKKEEMERGRHIAPNRIKEENVVG
jgi:hypothetical protein